MASTIVSRPRPARLLKQRRWGNRNTLISGPAGSGKSVLALLMAILQADWIHYVGARGLPAAIEFQPSPTWQGAEHIAELLNLLVHPHEQQLAARSQALLEDLPLLPVTDRAIVVLDDLDLISYPMLAAVQLQTSRIRSRVGQAELVLVARYGIEEIASFFGLRGQLGIISADMLTIKREELPALIAHASFDGASPERVQQAFEQAGGWFAGMQRMVEPEETRESSFDDFVLNELLMLQPSHVQNITIALSKFPYFSTDLVSALFREMHAPAEHAAGLFSQLPTVEGNVTGAANGAYTLAPQLRLSLARVGRFVGNQAVIQGLHVAGVRWFLNSGDYDGARSLALATGFVDDYLASIQPRCAMFASEERWTEIRALLIDIPYDVLEQSSDLAFWRMIAESRLGNLNELSKLVGAVYERWRMSDDPMRRGRAELMAAWRHWGQSRPTLTLEHATRSSSILPKEAVQDRMFAVIAAENAARNLGDVDRIEYWSAMNGRTRPVAAMRLEWWHLNCGYHRLSHLATTGRLHHAYHLAEMSLGEVNPGYPGAAFRYPLLQAYIDLEAGQLERAEHQLGIAKSYSLGVMTDNQLELLAACIALARQQVDHARDLLRVGRTGERTRPDQYEHRVRILADVELAAGNVDLAHDIISNWCEDEEAWPKYFGEPNHQALKARILAVGGRLHDAIEAAQFVINEARRRNHGYYLVMALAIQAECHARLGRTERAEAALARICECAGSEAYGRSFAPLGHDVRRLADLDVAAPGTVTKPLAVASVFPGATLTKRESELLRAAADGASIRELADAHFISQSTVKNHMTSIYRKLGVNSRKEAVDLVFPLSGTQQD